MRWPRSKSRWLLSACLISLLLLTPTDCKGLQLVGAIRSSLLWPAPPHLSFATPRQDDLVEEVWRSCAVVMRILHNDRNQSRYTHLLNIIRHSHRTNNENTSPSKINLKEVITTTLSSAEVANNFLDCLGNHNFPFPYASGKHREMHQQGEETRRLFQNSNNIIQPFGTKRRYLIEGASAAIDPPLAQTQYSCPPPAKQAIRRNVLSFEAEDRPLVTSIKTGGKNKSKDDSSTIVIAGLSVACLALVALICVICCVCRGDESSESPYDLRDDKPLLSLNLSDLSGSSRKSCATPIDVSRLGALSRTSSERQHKVVGVQMSMKSEFEQRINMKAMKLSSHEIATVAGQPVASTNAGGVKPPAAAGDAAAAPCADSGESASAPPAGPTPPPPPPPPPPFQKAPAAPPSAAAPAPPPPAAPKPPPPPGGGGGSSNPPPPGPPPPPAPRAAAGPGPPPPPTRPGGGPPPPAMPGAPKPRGPPPFKKSGAAAAQAADSNKTKLKPFFWDKVTASPDQAMVWDQIKAGSFQFNEEKIESLFGCHAVDKKSGDGKKDLAAKEGPQLVRILDAKKAQNLAISLKALSVSAEEVRNAVMEGLELPTDLIQTLIRWTPTSDEELRLRLYAGELTQLGPAEQFLRTIIDIPYIYQRLDVLLFMSSLPEEAANAEQSFKTIEVACQELRYSRLFKKLLEAVLKTGNRMNDGTFRGGAQAFKLDTLLKLSDVKGVDGKTTLLHFVVQEICRSEGIRAVRAAKEQINSSMSSVSSADDLTLTEDVGDDIEHYKQLGLTVVSNLGDDLQNVRKAACLDSDALTISVASLGHKLVKANDFLNTGMKSLDEDSGFHHKLTQFIEKSQVQVTHLLEEEKKLRSLVRTTVDYFHGSTGKDEGLRLFVVVRDFLAMLDKVCKEVKEAAAKAAAANKKPAAAAAAAAASKSRQSSSQTSSSFRDPRQNLIPAIQDRRGAAGHSSSSSSSDDDS
ncbi:hypothetical protein ACP4OV_010314 [Aristida adscensionis]